MIDFQKWLVYRYGSPITNKSYAVSKKVQPLRNCPVQGDMSETEPLKVLAASECPGKFGSPHVLLILAENQTVDRLLRLSHSPAAFIGGDINSSDSSRYVLPGTENFTDAVSTRAHDCCHQYTTVIHIANMLNASPVNIALVNSARE